VAAITILTGLAAVGFQTFRTAGADPVQSLRRE